LDGYTSDESTPEEDAGPYDDLFQSTDVGDPTYLTMYDEGSPSVITLRLMRIQHHILVMMSMMMRM
jgi:hypothetical protein